MSDRKEEEIAEKGCKEAAAAAAETFDMEAVLEFIGKSSGSLWQRLPFGKFQLRFWLCTGYCSFFPMAAILSYTFTAASTAYRFVPTDHSP